VQAVATAIPIGLVAWWVLRLVGALWRRTVWHALGAQLAALQRESSGELVPVFGGYRLDFPNGTSVRYTFGLRGRRTRWISQAGRGVREGWRVSAQLPITASD